MKKTIRKIFDKKHISRTISYLVVIAGFVIIQLLMNTIGIKSLFRSLLVPTCCYIVVALALNLVVGVSGELSLGHSGFMAVGAFTGIIISGLLEPYLAINWLRLLIAMFVGGIMAGIVGLFISVPVLKLQGDYLAIVTLAFCQIIKSLLNNVYLGVDINGLHFSFVENRISLAQGGRMLLSGPMGAIAITRLATFTAGFLLILFTLLIIYNLTYSRFGRSIMAARDNRIAAESVGIHIRNTKMLAFVISAILAGMAGALFGLNYSTLQPAKFDFNLSILILVYVVLGGLGNMTGTIISTMILYALPELLRGLQDYRMLIYSIILILIMLVTNNQTLKEKTENLITKIKSRFLKKGSVAHD
ncbi:MAG: branched-chain amino acid ABC transporter permease [Bacillota bacterium]|jgi:branched-chain amino acid transport system permease protein|nr:branched-chain amino acid ABC transporter permease [Bacillota bacterium]NLL26592.1 branched-chain amino acid ABC transporter permease [Erysipelotrichia bacterium]